MHKAHGHAMGVHCTLCKEHYCRRGSNSALQRLNCKFLSSAVLCVQAERCLLRTNKFILIGFTTLCSGSVGAAAAGSLLAGAGGEGGINLDLKLDLQSFEILELFN